MYSELNTGFIVFTNSKKGDDLHSALDEFLITGKGRTKPLQFQRLWHVIVRQYFHSLYLSVLYCGL